VDADLKGYFDSIPQDRLMDRMRERIADGRILALVEQFLQQGVLENGELHTPETGTPQGGVLSPLLANLYLNPLDHQMEQAGYRMIRYADDLVILCRSAEEAQAALHQLQNWTQREGLQLHPEKTRVVDMTHPRAGFDFLGYHFERLERGPITRWPRPKSLTKYKDRIRQLTRRTNGQSMQQIVREVNRVTVGWYEYFKHSHRNTFPQIDSWIRQRLRAILRRRRGGQGRGRGSDHQRWPNAYFTELGFFSMSIAHHSVGQSARR
jgi:RNA-directed DNA polymerase